jgi:hypothetical protein
MQETEMDDWLGARLREAATSATLGVVVGNPRSGASSRAEVDTEEIRGRASVLVPILDDRTSASRRWGRVLGAAAVAVGLVVGGIVLVDPAERPAEVTGVGSPTSTTPSPSVTGGPIDAEAQLVVADAVARMLGTSWVAQSTSRSAPGVVNPLTLTYQPGAPDAGAPPPMAGEGLGDAAHDVVHVLSSDTHEETSTYVRCVAALCESGAWGLIPTVELPPSDLGHPGAPFTFQDEASLAALLGLDVATARAIAPDTYRMDICGILLHPAAPRAIDAPADLAGVEGRACGVAEVVLAGGFFEQVRLFVAEDGVVPTVGAQPSIVVWYRSFGEAPPVVGPDPEDVTELRVPTGDATVPPEVPADLPPTTVVPAG